MKLLLKIHCIVALGAAVCFSGCKSSSPSASTSTGSTGAGGTSSSTTSTGSTTTTTTASATTASGTSATSGSGGGGTGTCDSPNTTADCAKCTNNASCAGDPNTAGCCSNASFTGLTKANELLVKDCACAAGSTCNGACSGDGNVCPGMQSQPSADCITCLDGLTQDDACHAAFQTDCEADADCADYLKCFNACPSGS